jgi:hypothetical protein
MLHVEVLGAYVVADYCYDFQPFSVVVEHLAHNFTADLGRNS